MSIYFKFIKRRDKSKEQDKHTGRSNHEFKVDRETPISSDKPEKSKRTAGIRNAYQMMRYIYGRRRMYTENSKNDIYLKTENYNDKIHNIGIPMCVEAH